ncbi:unnamed protein product [Heligmosomoides polygyrus]|uniref:RxLR effector protein n=1 Tax=Heligmosomoides polygyrus TaxID=6339 RepID=A0A183FLI0_HELPZ|nr:unnamed protein product [Heligmosomoides polygyrus]
MIALLLLMALLSAYVDCQVVEGSAATRPRVVSKARVFDLPKFAPMARIIKLSTSLRKKHHRNGDDMLLRDAAGSFDNFEAFDLGDVERDSSSGEVKKPSRQQGTARKATTQEENIGDFFPESG